MITLARPTNTPNLVEIGSQGAPPHSGEISHFCDLKNVLPFFLYFFLRFLISPTGRNFQPIRTLDSSNDVFCFVHVPFGVLEPSNSFLPCVNSGLSVFNKVLLTYLLTYF